MKKMLAFLLMISGIWCCTPSEQKKVGSHDPNIRVVDTLYNAEIKVIGDSLNVYYDKFVDKVVVSEVRVSYVSSKHTGGHPLEIPILNLQIPEDCPLYQQARDNFVKKGAGDTLIKYKEGEEPHPDTRWRTIKIHREDFEKQYSAWMPLVKIGKATIIIVANRETQDFEARIIKK
jgi:hypothetical protein